MNNTAVKLPIFDTISDAGSYVHGSKIAIWLTILTFSLPLQILQLFTRMINNVVLAGSFLIVLLILNHVVGFGQKGLAFKRMHATTVRYSETFSAFAPAMVFKFICVMLLRAVIYLPFLILVTWPTAFKAEIAEFSTAANVVNLIKLLTACSYLIGMIGFIYLYQRLRLAEGFLLERNYGPYQAIKASYRATKGNVLRLFSVSFLVCVILALSMPVFLFAMVPGVGAVALLLLTILSIGCIWGYPLFITAYAPTYTKLAPNADISTI